MKHLKLFEEIYVPWQDSNLEKWNIIILGYINKNGEKLKYRSMYINDELVFHGNQNSFDQIKGTKIIIDYMKIRYKVEYVSITDKDTVYNISCGKKPSQNLDDLLMNIEGWYRDKYN